MDVRETRLKSQGHSLLVFRKFSASGPTVRPAQVSQASRVGFGFQKESSPLRQLTGRAPGVSLVAGSSGAAPQSNGTISSAISPPCARNGCQGCRGAPKPRVQQNGRKFFTIGGDAVGGETEVVIGDSSSLKVKINIKAIVLTSRCFLPLRSKPHDISGPQLKRPCLSK